MGVQAGHNDGVDPELLEQDVEAGLEEAAIAAFGDDEVLVAKLKFGDNLGSGGTDHSVLTPYLELTVDLGEMRIVAENDGDAGLAGGVEKSGSGGYDVDGPLASEGTIDKILKHIDDQHCGVAEDQRFLGVFHID